MNTLTPAEKPKTLDAALARIEELETALGIHEPELTAREREIRRRMMLGKISREAATMAVDHQEIEDGNLSKSKTGKK